MTKKGFIIKHLRIFFFNFILLYVCVCFKKKKHTPNNKKYLSLQPCCIAINISDDKNNIGKKNNHRHKKIYIYIMLIIIIII